MNPLELQIGTVETLTGRVRTVSTVYEDSDGALHVLPEGKFLITLQVSHQPGQQQVAVCASCGIDERFPTAAHMLDCPIPVNLQSAEPELGK